MAANISGRNGKVNAEIFPPGMPLPINGLLKCGVRKKRKPKPREIFLGDWLEFFGIGPGEAASIAGCSQSYISNISGGTRKNVNALYLLAISEHLGINVNDFFRPLPSQSQLNSLKELSPKAQAAILARKPRKG